MTESIESCMRVSTDLHAITSSEKLVLQDLQKRSSMSIKSSVDTETYSYRQFLRIIDRLVDTNYIRGWVPVLHPFSGNFKKLVWFFLRTNPRDPQDLEFLQSLGGQLLSLNGIAGPYSLLALIQFSSDDDFNKSLVVMDEHFSTPNPVYHNMRYQYLEIIAFYKYNGFIITNQELRLSQQDITLQNILSRAGIQKNRPPIIEEIASLLNVSNSTVHKQLKQLEAKQSILGYSIIINPALQPHVKSIIQFHVYPGKFTEVIDVLRNDIHISLLCKIQKDSFNLLAVVFASSIPAFNAWLTELYTTEGILDTLTTIVLKNENLHSFNEHFPIL